MDVPSIKYEFNLNLYNRRQSFPFFTVFSHLITQSEPNDLSLLIHPTKAPTQITQIIFPIRLM